jgi:NADH-quinone oxidoreductase subunit L
MDFFHDAAPGAYALAILLLPLAGFLWNACTWKTDFTRRNGHVVPLLTIGVALFCSLSIFKHAIFDAPAPGHEEEHAAAPHESAGADHGAAAGHDAAADEQARPILPAGSLADPRWRWSSKDHGLAATIVDTGALRIDAGITIDRLTATMLVVVTIVAFLVHLYSVGYMHGDKRFSRFFAFLQLFSFSMLGLVLTDNLLLLFCFWELVGVCSYFLIGFWFEQDEPPKASIKAFMTNRFGDVGFLIGLLLVWRMFGTFDLSELYTKLQAVAEGHAHLPALFGWSEVTLLTVAGLCLFAGPMAKSAQFPLHVWLPDAMAGPTPVSALIHAATMVAAGVYMVGRIYWFFTPGVLLFIAIVGTITALMAATIGLVHHNIKKVLAYSTCSQLGYMMLALGVGGYSAGLFHLYTHAFFKACLFLGAGSVIHAVHTEDMRQMGGLREKMPVTYKTFLIATLALAGLPPLTGAMSKEMIVEHAITWGASGNLAQWLPAIVAVFGGGLTFFYMLRLVYLTFWGQARDHHRFEHAHESPATMTVPLLVLGLLSLVSAGWPIPFFGGKKLPALLAPPPALGEHVAGHAPHHAEESFGLAFLVLVISVGVLALAFLLYRKTYKRRAPGPEVWAGRFGGVYTLVSRLYYVDELYQATIVRFGRVASGVLAVFDGRVIDAAVNGVGRAGESMAQVWGAFDRIVVDGLVNLFWHVSHALSRLLRRAQSGNVQDYLAFAVGGMALVTLMFLFLA